MTNTTTPAGATYRPVWINDNGYAVCLEHAGHYLRTAVANVKDRLATPVHTPLGTWDVIDAQTAREHDVVCEVCDAH